MSTNDNGINYNPKTAQLKVLALSTNQIKWKLTNLDTTYSRSDRKVLLEIFLTKPNYDSQMEDIKTEYQALVKTSEYQNLALEEKDKKLDEYVTKLETINKTRNTWIDKYKNFSNLKYEIEGTEKSVSFEDYLKGKELYPSWTEQKVHPLHEGKNILPQDNKTLKSLKAKISETETYVDGIDTLVANSKYTVRATIYYSYTNFFSVGQDFNLPELNTMETMRKMKAINSNSPNSMLGDQILNTATNELQTLEDYFNNNLEKGIKDYFKGHVEFLLQKYNDKKITYTGLAKELIELGYFGMHGSPFFLYYPFITATELIYTGWDKWWDNILMKRRREYPLREQIESSIVAKASEISGSSGGINVGVIRPSGVPTVEYNKDWLLPSTNVSVATGSTQYKVLFPPILESYQPSFVGKNTSEYRIYFRLPDYINYSEVAHVDFRITLQSNNSSVVNSQQWPDQVIYKLKETKNNISDIVSHGNGLYSTTIKTDILNSGGKYDLIAGHWEDNTYYKVQARLGTSWSGWNTPAEYVTWRNEQSAQGNFSEWSTVMILKSIAQPTVQILNNRTLRESLSAEDTMVEVTTTPLFYGQYSQSDNNGGEFLDTYQFILYDENDKELENSGILQYNNTMEQDTKVTISHRFNRELIPKEKEEYENYTVKFIATTVNGYTASDIYTFQTSKSLDKDNDLKSENFNLIAIPEEEDGIIKLQLQALQPNKILIGNYIITRRKIKENHWEDLKILLRNDIFDSENLEKEIYTDYTPESGEKYQYRIQRINVLNQRNQGISSEEVSVDFEYMFLYDGERQLKLKYNSNISSFKHTVLASKQDTLGGKFPYINRNGFVYYAEFPIEALISFNMDENGHFVSKASLDPEEDLIRVREKGIINSYKEKNEDKEERHQRLLPQQSSSTNLTYENIYNEKFFRDEVEKFLNNGSYKLFRSSTEGNLIISLMNVSFSPKKELGRMISTVTANAYEMADYTINNLKTYNLITVGTYQDALGEEQVCGQLFGVFNQNNNLFTEIQKQIEVDWPESEEYQYVLKNITDIYLTPYPRVRLEDKINLAYAYETSSNVSSDNIKILQNKTYMDLITLQDALQDYNTYTPIYLNLKGKRIIALPDTPYVLENQNILEQDNMYIEKLTEGNSVFDAHYPPVIINYFGNMKRVENKKGILESSYRRTGFNQLNGYFLEANKNPYFIIDNDKKITTLGEATIEYYNSLDIIEIIKEQIRLQLIDENRYELSDREWEGNIIKDLKNKVEIELTELPKIIIQTRGQKDVHFSCGKENDIVGEQGYVLKDIALNNTLKFTNATMVNALITYDYSFIVKSYLDLPDNKEGDKNE